MDGQKMRDRTRERGKTNLDIVPLMVVATLTEQPMVHHIVDVQLVQQRVTVLGNRCGKHHHFIKLANPLHELVHAGPLDHIDVVVLSLDLDWDGEISAFQDLR